MQVEKSREENREEFKLLLQRVATERANINALNFMYDANVELVNLINNGVDRMSNEEYASEYRKQIVEDNLLVLIDKMRNSTGRVESIDSTKFLNTWASICPLWPFC